MSSDVQLLLAAQAAGSSPAIRTQFAERFLKFLRYRAGQSCCLHKLHLTYVDDVVSLAMAMFFDAKYARFKAGTCVGHLTYLEGLVKNAAKIHCRFVKKGSNQRQQWDDSVVFQLGLPTCMEEVSSPERVPPIEVAEEAAIALSVATSDELVLVHQHFFEDESIVFIASEIGVARTTVTRRLNRFYARAAAELAA